VVVFARRYPHELSGHEDGIQGQGRLEIILRVM
jgi:hypothetical protein